jgi:hypothetical protein
MNTYQRIIMLAESSAKGQPFAELQGRANTIFGDIDDRYRNTVIRDLLGRFILKAFEEGGLSVEVMNARPPSGEFIRKVTRRTFAAANKKTFIIQLQTELDDFLRAYWWYAHK